MMIAIEDRPTLAKASNALPKVSLPIRHAESWRDLLRMNRDSLDEAAAVEEMLCTHELASANCTRANAIALRTISATLSDLMSLLPVEGDVSKPPTIQAKA